MIKILFCDIIKDLYLLTSSSRFSSWFQTRPSSATFKVQKPSEKPRLLVHIGLCQLQQLLEHWGEAYRLQCREEELCVRVTESECVLMYLILDTVIASPALQWSAAPVQIHVWIDVYGLLKWGDFVLTMTFTANGRCNYYGSEFLIGRIICCYFLIMTIIRFFSGETQITVDFRDQSRDLHLTAVRVLGW